MGAEPGVMIPDSGLLEARRIKKNKKLTELETRAQALGYRITDTGKLKLITREWAKEQKAKETEMKRLARRARNGDREAIRKLALGAS
jgi:hypothetical protein